MRGEEEEIEADQEEREEGWKMMFWNVAGMWNKDKEFWKGLGYWDVLVLSETLIEEKRWD